LQVFDHRCFEEALILIVVCVHYGQVLIEIVHLLK